MIKVQARGEEPIEFLLKRFKKVCEKEGLTKDIKRNSYYEKPSEVRRRKVRQAVKKELKRLSIREKQRQKVMKKKRKRV
jgi:small subunit ribosomal protein S21